MTIEEAIKIVRGESVGHPVSCDEQINAAECVADCAEKYLKQKEAWEKVEKEINDSILICRESAQNNIWNDGELAGFLQSKDIINENLSEVSE